ncbi:MAG: S-adenosylmethionine decarboxylase [Prolixibacteraceae bacterium]|jgi:S-adenosylmethionine decarboxylase|nr:S-adenosylmethionine decarboxylase [Prolixibacteraceae bacterium]
MEHKDIEANIYKYSGWIEDLSSEILRTHFASLLTQSTFQVLSFSEYHFPVQGYSCVWLLGESHLALHTFPKQKGCYFELSSCNQEKMIAFQQFLHQDIKLKLIKEEQSYSSLS